MNTDQGKFLLDLMLPVLEMESRTTRRVIAAVPDDRRDYRPDPRYMTAWDLAWHIVRSEVYLLGGVANGVYVKEDRGVPETVRTVGDVVAWYGAHLSDLVAQIRALPAERLAQPVELYRVFNWPAVTYIDFALHHSVHHRGQLSTYLRPMGAKVPAIYGGSADEPFTG